MYFLTYNHSSDKLDLETSHHAKLPLYPISKKNTFAEKNKKKEGRELILRQ